VGSSKTVLRMAISMSNYDAIQAFGERKNLSEDD
jgi:hypothetical protein